MGTPARSENTVQRAQRSHIYVICNTCSGSAQQAETRNLLKNAFEQSDAAFELVEITAGQSFLAACRAAAERAQQNNGVLVAAGGDGTVNYVASLCREYGLTLGILPLGTFNYFARELNIPGDLAEAARVISAGFSRDVSIGYVNDHLFLNNASFGLYTRIIRNRERDKSHFGRYRIVAFFSALATLFQKQRPLSITLQVGDETIKRKTAMVFVGNNTLQLKNFDLEVSECTRHDRLAVILMKKVSYWDTVRLIVRGLFKRLDDEQRLEMLCADFFDVSTRSKQVDVVIDGELIRCTSPLRFTVARQALQVLVPQPSESLS